MSTKKTLLERIIAAEDLFRRWGDMSEETILQNVADKSLHVYRCYGHAHEREPSGLWKCSPLDKIPAWKRFDYLVPAWGDGIVFDLEEVEQLEKQLKKTTKTAAKASNARDEISRDRWRASLEAVCKVYTTAFASSDKLWRKDDFLKKVQEEYQGIDSPITEAENIAWKQFPYNLKCGSGRPPKNATPEEE